MDGGHFVKGITTQKCNQFLQTFFLTSIIEVTIEGTGRNTLGVIDKALKVKSQLEKQPGRVVDEVWAVFDRDSFPNQDFDNAIAKARELAVHCAWSNEAFELWYLLHFQNFENAMSRHDYKKLLERELSRCIGKPYQYEKSDHTVFDLLIQHGNEEQAIKRAKQLEEQFAGRTDYASHNPCTRVYVLVEKLRLQSPPNA
ncbi:RloB domain-containing protein [Spirosoma utsteinense]|uniref:RloB domain-containing protein n=1 Tax=Spirosoma utsteinense TaxID=2585773 RepID=UPI00164484F1